MELKPQDQSDVLYTGDAYVEQNPDWHLADAPNKAIDLRPAFKAILQRAGTTATLTTADIGAGAGGVLAELTAWLAKDYPSLKFRPVGFEIATAAVAMAKQKFPSLEMRQQYLEATDGPFDVTMFVDVLEHVENPWELLRTAAGVSRFLIVRQPLLQSYSMFRHNGYANQRTTWGHIGLFNYHSFNDMAAACGWKPLAIDLVPPWQLAGNDTNMGTIGRWLARRWPLAASQFFSGFYLNGVYERIEPRA